MSEYAELIEEKRQLEYRRNFLLDKIKTKKFGPEATSLIYDQLTVMSRYLQILKDRIDNAYDERNL